MTSTTLATIDPQMILLAFVTGFLPVILWLLFWLWEDHKNPEPKSLILYTFTLGLIAVFVAFFLEKLFESPSLEISGWIGWLSTLPFINMAVIEELVKFSAIAFIIGRNRHLDEPIDAMIYMITVALGFASMENLLFLINSLSQQETFGVFLFTGGLRFLGSTILHTVCSALIGATWALTFYKKSLQKWLTIFSGVILAIALHTAFNFLIIISGGQMMLPIMFVLWIFVLIILFLFELAKRVKPNF